MPLSCMALALLSCAPESQSVAPSATPPSVRDFVAGEAANHLTGRGEIVLGGPLELSRVQISEERARDLADAFRFTHLSGIIQFIEKDRGADIDPNKVRACGRAYYAEPAVEPLPDEVGPALQRGYGPFWIITFCGSTGQRELSIAVSAYATELGIRAGLLTYPMEQGEFFRILAIPVGQPDGLPTLPEHAISEVVSRTGARAIAVPRLVYLPRTYPQLAFWRLELARAVRVRSLLTGTISTTSTVFYSTERHAHVGAWVAARDGPRKYEYVWVKQREVAYGQRPIFSKSTIAARNGMPLRLEPVQESK